MERHRLLETNWATSIAQIYWKRDNTALAQAGAEDVG